MKLSALLTSAGINVAICVVLFSLYSILRKQPSMFSVYFGRKLASGQGRCSDHFWLERFVPSPSWIMRAWETNEEELLTSVGLDGVVFLRMVLFSIRILAISSIICILLVLPVNYYGQERMHHKIHSESVEVFTIENVKEGSKWLWAHCLALYVISIAACLLLYFEYKEITKMRLAHITGSSPKPNQFTVLIRSIPSSQKQSYSESVRKLFTTYYSSSYLSHQMVYHSGTVHKLVLEAEKMYTELKTISSEAKCKPDSVPCFLCGGKANFQMLSSESESQIRKMDRSELSSVTREKESPAESAAVFVFLKTRYDALVISEILQSSNPMLWVTELAPEPHDVYWSNLSIPYKQLWIRKIATLVGAVFFMIVFLAPVTFIQSMTQLEKLPPKLQFLEGLWEKKIIHQLITGYLPSVILMLFLYTVPPIMMLFSVLEGSISRSGRKRSACIKVLNFTIWNVFFFNILSGSIIKNLDTIARVKDLPELLATAIPNQASFFTTYVFTSGWASLACEIVQPYPLFYYVIRRYIFRNKDDSSIETLSFPYHTEIPRILLFGVIGFTCSIMAPMILAFLLVYFSLAYLVYKNQIMNVYVTKYESGGQLWPVFHNTTIFSVVLTQFIALGVFGIKRSPVATGFTIPLIFFTLLFNEYCRQRFHPIFARNPAELLMDMDSRDQQSGRIEEIHEQLQKAYCQFPLHLNDLSKVSSSHCSAQDKPDPDPEAPKTGKVTIGEIESWEVVTLGKNEPSSS